MADGTKPRRICVERGIYRQANGNYAVCARRAGRLHFRTAGTDLAAARGAREDLIAALEAGRVPASPRLRFDTVAARWSERFEAMVAAGDRHPRTYEAHRFLDHDLLPRLGSRRIASLGVEDVAELITELRAVGRSAKTTANALGTLQSVLRFARRRGWILPDPVELLEPEEQPHPPRHSRGRVLGQAEIERLLDACPSQGRILVETALFSGLRISELLGLTWATWTSSLDWSGCAPSSPAHIAANRPGASPPRRPLRCGRCHWFPSFPTASPPIAAPHHLPSRPTGSL